MFMRGIEMHAAVLAGLLLSCTAPALCQTPAASQVLSPTPKMDVPAARPAVGARAKDYFAGLTLTDEEKVKIEKIHRDTDSRVDLVQRDDKLDAAQKDAMINGIARLERGQIFQILTPEQRQAVLKKYKAAHPTKMPAPRKMAAPPAGPK